VNNLKLAKKINSWKNKIFCILVVIALIFISLILHRQNQMMLYIKKVDQYQSEQIRSNSDYIESLQTEVSNLKDLQAMKANEVKIEEPVAEKAKLSSTPLITPVTTVLLATGTVIATVCGIVSKLIIIP
jgi:predicted Holliday junction resolvase-like endonuclease